ncbi:GLPGLI family protein [Chryseobacterium sp. JUb7]|uniref:GLPGLI family protein n=1 Tax=Chryseobacterium sp. JUb7 TaxID=2940599 RepID=UPI00216A4481|nr:GLPGLI family protein [Chryseobacterium sp. JUb7]MCS3533081.1 GLPGLI family protein [Chryseobacterium sp. JUb7]
MKLLFLIFLSFFPSTLTAQKIDSSNIKISYIVKFLRDTTDVTSKKEEITGLWIGGNTSIFKSDQKAKYDSLALETIKNSIKNATDGNMVIDFSKLPKPSFVPEVYKKDHTIDIFDKILNTTYEFQAQEEIKWIIINETKTIGAYKCRKATGRYRNKNITAWYTEEIPISEGPYTFKGLPGLVVEAYDDKYFFHFIFVGLSNIKEPIISIRNTVKTDYIKFIRKRNDFQNDPVGAYFSATGKTIAKEQQERILKLHKSRNNHLD